MPAVSKPIWRPWNLRAEAGRLMTGANRALFDTLDSRIDAWLDIVATYRQIALENGVETGPRDRQSATAQPPAPKP